MAEYQIISWVVKDNVGRKIKKGFHDYKSAIASYNARIKSGQIVLLKNSRGVLKTNKSGNPMDWSNPEKCR